MTEHDVFGTTAGVVQSAVDAVLDITNTEFWKVPDRDLLTLARQVERLARLVHAAQIHLAGEVDTRGMAETHGASSAAALLRTTLGVSQGDAKAMIATAAVVLPRDVPSGGELPAALPLLAEALAEGDLGMAQTRTVVNTMRKLPAEVDDATRALVQQQLVEQGRVTEPAPFAVFARAILATLDQDGKDFDEDPPADHMEFTLGSRNPNTGLTRITGQVDDIGVEIINQAIDTLSRPKHGGAETSSGAAGAGRGNGSGNAVNNNSGGGTGGVNNAGCADTGSNGTGKGADAGGAGTATGGRRGGQWAADPRPAATRRAQAILEALRRFLDLGEAPLHGGERPHITVTMTLRDLLGPSTGSDSTGASDGRDDQEIHSISARSGPPPVLDYGGPITPAQARMLACDARIIPAVLGGASQVLDIGTSNRLFPPHIRRAIALRDRGCTFPGCDRPPGWTDAHHVCFWVDNGKTAYENGCLLCRHHHSEIHRGHWTIRFAPDGVPEFTPPPWVDPTRTPLRNTLHHIPTLLSI